jgi:predicted 2-oxoglutarate/Fe(II)-dependent dioxygenase YbiX
MTVLDASAHVFTIPDVLTPAECQALIRASEALGYAEAPITTALGPVMAPGVRNNTRVMVDDPKRAAALYERVFHALPLELEGWSCVGLNERLRFYRYTEGQQFRWHFDGSYHRSHRERSMLSLLIYLSQDCEGGHTEFASGVSVEPRAGMALAFVHRVEHRGAPVLTGRKYVLRSDVMYSKP